MNVILRKLLLAYRPLDARLRRIGPYARVSRALQQRYNILITNQDISSGRKTADINAYIENLDLIRPRPDTILFECYWGRKFADNTLAIYRELLRSQPRGKFRIIWVTRGSVAPPDEIDNNPDVVTVPADSAEYGIALLEAGYLVNNVTFPPYFIRRSGQRYCNTWHGLPMKAMGRDMVAPLISMANTQRNFLQADILLDMGDFYHQATIQPYYISQLVAGSLVACGAPRVDDVLNSRIPQDHLRARYGIKTTQKIVLFAPTWRGDSLSVSPVFSDQARIYTQIAQELGSDYFVLFSAHQMMRADRAATVPNGAIIKDNDNINDILPIVDVMVSDYSSIIFDFLPTDRALVLFTPDIEQYRQERGLYLEPADLPCANTENLPQLITAIQAARRPSQFPDVQAMLRRFVPLDDGHASKMLLAALLDSSHAPTHRQADGRKRILIAPGGMVPNGITTSLKNLIANLDYDHYDPYVLIDAQVMDSDAARLQQFEEFDPRCNWILRSGEMLMTPAEKQIYHVFRQGDELAAEDMDVVRGIFEREYSRVLGDVEFDVAIEFAGYAPYWASLIACAKAARKVCYQHNHLWAEYNNSDVSRNQRQLYGVFQTYRWFDQIVAVSDETRKVNESNLQQFYRAGSQVRTVRNTVNVRRVHERARMPVALAHPQAAAPLQDPERFCFIALGRLSPEKRYDRMIGALATIAPDYPNAILMICGSGPLRADLEKLAHRKSISKQVCFMGQVANPYPLLAMADACVMSSDYEGQPMTLLEALCLGTVCIGSDILGIRAVLKDGRGHIVAPTEEAFAQIMRVAIEGNLPPLATTDIGDEYISRTMGEFYVSVCGDPTGVSAELIPLLR